MAEASESHIVRDERIVAMHISSLRRGQTEALTLLPQFCVFPSTIRCSAALVVSSTHVSCVLAVT